MAWLRRWRYGRGISGLLRIRLPLSGKRHFFSLSAASLPTRGLWLCCVFLLQVGNFQDFVFNVKWDVCDSYWLRGSAGATMVVRLLGCKFPSSGRLVKGVSGVYYQRKVEPTMRKEWFVRSDSELFAKL